MSREIQHIGGGKVVATDIIDTVADLRCEKTDDPASLYAHWYNVSGKVNGIRYGAKMIISDELMADAPIVKEIIERGILRAAKK